MRFFLTVRGLMIVVAFLGVSMGAFRQHFSLGCFVSTVLVLGFVRTSQKIDLWGSGLESSARGTTVVGVYLTSVLIATLIYVLALIPGLVLLPYSIPAISRPAIDPFWLFFGAVVTCVPIIRGLKRWLW